MNFSTFGKWLIPGVVALGLVGCATGPEQYPSDQYEPLEPRDEAAAEVGAVSDPAVLAVMESGKVDSLSPAEIAQYLNQRVVHFKFDSSAIRPEDELALQVQAAYLTSELGRGQDIRLEGHTDKRGTRTYNLSLGERRANAVRNYLVTQGVGSRQADSDDARFEVISFGLEKPIREGSDEEAYRENRRTEIFLED